MRPNPFGYSTEAQKHAGRRSVKLFNTIEGARTGMWCHADAGPLPSAWQCWQCSGLVSSFEFRRLIAPCLWNGEITSRATPPSSGASLA